MMGIPRSYGIALCASLTFIVAIGMFYPGRTNALRFGDLQKFFRPKTEAAVLGHRSPSVQAMSILKANMSLDPARGGPEIFIEDESAVRAQGGFGGETVMPEKDAISIYVVREGDTLSQIAEMFGVSVNTIRWANDISGPIRPGQMLTILPVSGVRYTVKQGDTLESIAKQYKGDAGEIAQFNGLTGPLAAGDVILIPNGQEVFEPAPTPARSGSATAAAPTQASPSYSGYYINPLPGGVRTQGIHGTNAVDLAAPGGGRPPIVASAAGEVIIALEGGWNGGYGSYVVIRHDNGTQTLYAHMSAVSIGKGQRVNQGQVIGYVGNSGRSTGPHLHFEIRGGPRNPF